MPLSHHEHNVPCHACGGFYDALKASWCERRSGHRTLVCPLCGECFCRAEVQYQEAYWDGILQRLRGEPEESTPELSIEDLPPDAELPDASYVNLSDYLNPAAAMPPVSHNGTAAEEDFHSVPCPHCGLLYDAASAIWCYCLGADRSPCCPSCLECWCAAPVESRRQLWSQAPGFMRIKRTRDLRRDFTPPPNPAPGAAERPLVLIAESDKHVLYIAARAVSVFGHHALLTGDGVEALALAQSHRPDFILANAMLPRLNGRELCFKLKQDPALSAIPVALITAVYTQNRYRHEAFKLYKVDDYLNMPVSVHQFRTLLEKFLPAERDEMRRA